MNSLSPQSSSTPFYNITDVCRILGIGKSKGYDLIKTLNNELAKQGFITIQGKVSKRYFEERVAI